MPTYATGEARVSHFISHFDQAEFESRLDRLRRAMRERGADLMLVDDIEILAWCTGYERSVSSYRACLVPQDGNPLMVLRALDIAPFREAAWFPDCVGYSDEEDGVAAVGRAIRERWGASPTLGIDGDSHALTVSGSRRLQAALPAATIVDMTGVPWTLRLLKSPLEIVHLEAAARIADQTVAGIAGMARPGMSTRDVSAFAAKRHVELGALPDHIGPITQGKGWGFLHGHLSDEPLTEGDILHLELVPRFRGYSARLMRSIVIGRPSTTLAGTARALFEIQDRQIAAMKPGTPASEVDAIMRDGALEAGLRESYENITGYTLGYYSQQAIRSSDFTRVFGRGSTWRLEPGMVFHMYTSAQGLAASETVLVEADGPRRLTRLERKLFSTG